MTDPTRPVYTKPDGWPHSYVRCPHGCPLVGWELNHNADCPIAVASQQMMEADRTWFESHPLATEYRREMMPGDIASSSTLAVITDDGKLPRVLVRHIGLGLRARSIIGDYLLLVPPVSGLTEADNVAAEEALAYIAIATSAGQLSPEQLQSLTTTRVTSTESPAEEALWRAYHHTNQPYTLTPQHKIGRYRLDFAIIDRKIAVEVDGLTYHNGQDSFIKDQQRQRDLQAQGWTVIRFAAKEVTDNPRRCLDEIARLAG